MNSKTPLLLGFCLAIMGSITTARAAGDSPVGIFESHADIGGVKHPGSASYDATTQEYLVEASGTNMWFDHDEFHFVWRRMKGDFLLQAMVEFVGQGVDPHRKVVLLVRQSLDPRSPYLSACRHGDGLTSMQWRRTASAATEEIRSSVTGPDVLQLLRRGQTYAMAVAKFGDLYTTTESAPLDLGDEVYVGVGVCAHNNAVSEKVILRNVRLVRPAQPDFVPYRDYIGSSLELLDVASGRRRIIHQVDDSLQAPNWTPDGKALICNRNGRMLRFDLATRASEWIDTGAQIQCNNDHALTFDGRMLGISSGQPSLVYTLPVTGGTPKLITPVGPSYLHGWSPDGKWLAFTGARDGNFDIYLVPAAGGPEKRLTNAPGLDDGSEYSADGQYIYFNSTRTGRMQLWRMKPDGSAQEQLTFDDFNNWFPHVSLDGKTLVFITYGPETKADDHPWYKHVYIRQMPAAGGAPRVLAYLYGGQGSMNVNSWSPDGRSIAFISNSAAW